VPDTEERIERKRGIGHIHRHGRACTGQEGGALEVFAGIVERVGYEGNG